MLTVKQFLELATPIVGLVEKMEALNKPGAVTRSRYLSLAITDLQSAENWLVREQSEQTE